MTEFKDFDWEKLKVDANSDNGFEQVEEPDYEAPRDDHEYVIAVGRDGTAIFMITPPIHYSFFDNARDHLDDNGFSIPEGLGAGIYKCHFHCWSSTDWESGHVDDIGFDCIGEPELLCSYEGVEEYEDNL